MCFYLTSGRPIEDIKTPVGGRHPMIASLTKQSHRRAVRTGDYGEMIYSEWNVLFIALPIRFGVTAVRCSSKTERIVMAVVDLVNSLTFAKGRGSF